MDLLFFFTLPFLVSCHFIVLSVWTDNLVGCQRCLPRDGLDEHFVIHMVMLTTAVAVGMIFSSNLGSSV